jgi:hypothetical protein
MLHRLQCRVKRPVSWRQGLEITGTIFFLAISTAAAGNMRLGNDIVDIADSAFIILT